MKRYHVVIATLAVALLLASSSFAQVNGGDSTYVLKKSGWPTVLTVGQVSNVGYSFDGSTLNIPFTLQGSGATVYLVVYTDWGKTVNPADFYVAGRAEAVTRAAGLDTMVHVSTSRTFAEGSGTLSWTGVDYHGNAVQGGNYTYYVIAIGENEDPTWVGQAGGAWRIDVKKDPPVIYALEWGGTLRASTIGTDYMSNPEAVTTWDMAGLVKFAEGGGPAIASLWIPGAKDEEDILYFAQGLGGAGTGAYKAKIVGATVELVQDFGDEGYVDIGCDRALGVSGAVDEQHPLGEDDGLLWMGHQGVGCVPMVAEAWPIDRKTGEVGEILDISDILVQHSLDSEGNPRTWVGAFSQHDNDAKGLLITGHNEERISYWDYDYGMWWMNDKGDWWGDKFDVGDEARETGRLWIYTGFLSKWEFAYIVGGGAPYQGVIFGPDGQGLVQMNFVNTPWSYNDALFVVPPETNPRLSGLYYQSTGQEKFGEGLPATILHRPYDIRMAKISTGAGPTNVEEVDGLGAPAEYALNQNYPNPFNPETTLRFAIPERGASSVTTVKVYNSSGQLVNTLVNQILGAGEYETVWDGKDSDGMSVSSGLYFSVMRSGDFTAAQKMTLLK